MCHSFIHIPRKPLALAVGIEADAQSRPALPQVAPQVEIVEEKRNEQDGEHGCESRHVQVEGKPSLGHDQVGDAALGDQGIAHGHKGHEGDQRIGGDLVVEQAAAQNGLAVGLTVVDTGSQLIQKGAALGGTAGKMPNHSLKGRLSCEKRTSR